MMGVDFFDCVSEKFCRIWLCGSWRIEEGRGMIGVNVDIGVFGGIGSRILCFSFSDKGFVLVWFLNFVFFRDCMVVIYIGEGKFFYLI